MKFVHRRPNVRDLLGLTQMEMAALLKISRAQWSMYESKRRNLPFEAEKILEEITLAYFRFAEDHKSPSKIVEPGLTAQQLKKLEQENELRRSIIGRRISEIESQAETISRCADFSNYLDKEPAGSVTDKVLRFFAKRSSATKNPKGLPRLSALRHELEIETFKKELIDAAYKNLK